MSFSLETAIDKVALELKISPKKHKEFLFDCDSLANWIGNVLKERNSLFADSFSNLPATATYTCGKLIDIPANFNCYLLLEPKFRYYVETKKDYIYIYSKKKHGTMDDSIIPSVCLQNNLRDDLYALLRPRPIVNCGERSFQLCFHTTIYPISAHTIIATQLNTKNNTRIVFEFLLGIKLPTSIVPRPTSVPMPEGRPDVAMDYWLALPVPHFDANFDSQSYRGVCHIWQLANAKQHQHWRLVILMFYLLSIGNGTLTTIGIHALKHTCVNLCEQHGLDQADCPLSVKLMNMMAIHSSLKLKEVSAASKSGHILNLDYHPAVSADCAKTDIMLSFMKAKNNSKKGVNLERFQLMFGLIKQQQNGSPNKYDL